MIGGEKFVNPLSYLHFIGEIKEPLSNLKGKHGDIVVYNDETYLFTNKWEPLVIDDSTQPLSRSSHPLHCECCGALMNSYKCEYCGAEY